MGIVVVKYGDGVNKSDLRKETMGAIHAAIEKGIHWGRHKDVTETPEFRMLITPNVPVESKERLIDALDALGFSRDKIEKALKQRSEKNKAL